MNWENWYRVKIYLLTAWTWLWEHRGAVLLVAAAALALWLVLRRQ